MARKRHHASKRHISAHDRAVDRENLMHARHGKHHESAYLREHDIEVGPHGEFESMKHMAPKRHLSAHDREMDRENLMHARRGKHKMYSYHEKPVHNPGINHERDRFNDEHHHDKDPRNGGMNFNNRLAMAANRNEFYAGMEPRRRMELEDAGMIHEDPYEIANLPQEVMIKPYPRTGPYLPEGLDDTIRGIDDQMDYDDEQRRDHFYPKKV